MLAEAIRAAYRYNRWATGRLLATAAALDPALLQQPGHAGHGSVLTTLLHVISVQRSWLSWWDGTLTAAEAIRLAANPEDYPDVASLRTLWEAVEGQTAAFLDRLDDDLAVSVYESTLPDGTVWRVPLWQMMLHVVNHGTQHRSEAAALLTELGHSPGALDMIFYLARPQPAPGQ